MYTIQQVKLPYLHTPEDLRKKIARTAGIPSGEAFSYSILRRSIDARDKRRICFVYQIALTGLPSGFRPGGRHNILTSTARPTFVYPPYQKRDTSCPPIVVGSGPAGLFCAYYLARAGYCPVILERGEAVEQRKIKVDAFWAGQALDPDCNVQFGEGGAGTFSDGKLNTLVKDRDGRGRAVLELFVQAGAPEEILYLHKPHLGTDQLVQIVRRIRGMIEELGGRFLFSHTLTGIDCKNGSLCAVETNHDTWMPARKLVLAIGHSARDTFCMLHQAGLPMEQKAFAVGVRVEHLQETINHAQYGDADIRVLGAADYKLTHTTAQGRGVYSFCMCPGGYVVNASSEEGMLAVNGMSNHARDGKNANSAIVVTISQSDYGGVGFSAPHGNANASYFSSPYDSANASFFSSPHGSADASFFSSLPPALQGIAVQRTLEQAAFRCAGGRVPVQLFGDFQKRRCSTALGSVEPQIKGQYALSNLRDIFPAFLGDAIEDGMLAFDRKLPGFAREDCVLSGVESRTSSPVRILRDDSFQSQIRGIYPCGEGAGYAGGITSAAMDGLKTGEKLIG